MQLQLNLAVFQLNLKAITLIFYTHIAKYIYFIYTKLHYAHAELTLSKASQLQLVQHSLQHCLPYRVSASCARHLFSVHCNALVINIKHGHTTCSCKYLKNANFDFACNAFFERFYYKYIRILILLFVCCIPFFFFAFLFFRFICSAPQNSVFTNYAPESAATATNRATAPTTSRSSSS